MRINKFETIGVLFIAVIFSFLGFFIAKSTTIPGGFVLNREISLINCITILINLFGIIAISYLLDHQKESSKVKRELVIRRIEELHDQIMELHKITASAEPVLTDVTETLKNIHMSIKRLQTLEKYMPQPKCEGSKGLFKSHRKLRDLMTGGDSKANKETPPPIRYADRNVFYSEKQIKKIEAEIVAMEENLFESEVTTARI